MSKYKPSLKPRYVVLAVIGLLVAFLLLLPLYLGPDDIASCDRSPNPKSPNNLCHQADAIVALSGGDTPARTAEAIKLYKKGWAKTLIFSGAAEDKTGPSNAQAMRKQALFQGVNAANILIEEQAVNTRQNASKTQNIIKDNNLHRIILVTSAYHQRRASLEFKKRVGSDVTVINHPVKYDKQWHKNWFLTPGGWWLAFSELAKIIGFYISGI